MKKVFLLSIMIVNTMFVLADDSGTCGDNLTWKYTVDTKTLTIEGTGNMTDYLSDLSVPWKDYKNKIEKVYISSGVTSIGNKAFASLKKISYIDIPYGVTSIGEGAFNNCKVLTSIAIPNSVTSIGNIAFADCAITSITIPNSVTSIGINPVSGCLELTSLKVEGGNTHYDSRNNCNAIIETTTNTLIAGCYTTLIPNSVTSIGEWAFAYCAITSITIPNSVTSIGNGAFCGCSVLTSITIPNSVTSIGDFAFNSCSELISVTIPNSVKSIGWQAFTGCSLTSVHISDLEAWCKILFYDFTSNPLYIAHHLYLGDEEIKDLVIPNSVTNIGKYTFYGCSGLTSVTISNSVTSIDYSAFCGCSGLSNIVVESSNLKYDSRDNCNAIIETTSNTLISGCKNTIIPNSVTSIGEGAFRDCIFLTSITIPNNITSIGETAFWGCSGLTSVIIGNSVTSIGDYAFFSCNGLASVTSLNWIPPTIDSHTLQKYSATLKVPTGSKKAYQNAQYWKNFTNIVEIDPTDIQTITLDKETNSPIYDLNGRRLEKPQKGINIIRGKKVIVK